MPVKLPAPDVRVLLQGRLLKEQPGASLGIATTPRGRARQSARVDGEILRMLARDTEPTGLTDAELELQRYAITRPPIAEPAWAWVRYGAIPIRVEAEVCAWTEKAGAARWVVPGKGVDRAWLWLGSLEPRSIEPTQASTYRERLRHNADS